MSAYSFLNCQASISGPNGQFNIGNGAGTAEEGITIAMRGDKNTTTVGADGTPMMSLHADKSSTVTVRLLKTSPVNAMLSQMYAADSSDSSLWGQNTITVRDSSRGDHSTCRQCAFKKLPDLTYNKEGPVIEWVFESGITDELLGTGTPAAIVGGF
jgi:hypothetical protein